MQPRRQYLAFLIKDRRKTQARLWQCQGARSSPCQPNRKEDVHRAVWRFRYHRRYSGGKDTWFGIMKGNEQIVKTKVMRWLEEWQRLINAADFARARQLFSDSVVSFGTL